MARNILNLTPEEEKRIETAVAEAEKSTSGEIVPFVTEQSDSYEDSVTKAGGIMLAIGLLLVLTAEILFPDIIGESAVLTAAVSVISGLVGMILTSVFPGLRVIFAGRKTVNRRVYLKALEAFLSEEVFRTRDRTGILIFISQLERKVIVLGDSGISQKVKQEEWTDVVRDITEGIHSNAFTDGLVRAVERCGLLLNRSGFEIRPDDTNELRNQIRKG